MEFLVTYDIATFDRAGERRLTQVAKTCEGFGMRVQKSVFECRLDRAWAERLRLSLLALVDPNVDQVNIYRFPGSLADARESLGRQVSTGAASPWIV